jgi:hypothetical protein
MARRTSIHEDEIETPSFKIDRELTRQYRRFNAMGTELTLRFLPPSDEDGIDLKSHFITSVNKMIIYALRNCEDSDMVGITIQNAVNMSDKAVGSSFRGKD